MAVARHLAGGALAGSGAVLTVFLGSAEVERPGASAFEPARTGDVLQEGSSVRTLAASKAALTLPDDSVTRLDALTTVRLSGLPTGSGAGTVQLFQSAGGTWNSVRQLARGDRFLVRGPHNATAEVRGTEFSFLVDPAGGDRVNVWSGAVALSAGGASVLVGTGESSSVPAGGAPTAPGPIADGDRRTEFTVFNQTLAATGRTPASLHGDTSNQGAVSAREAGATSDGSSDLDFTLGWPGSTFELDVFSPDGSLYSSRSSSSPPLTITVPKAAAGTWSYQVKDVQSDPGEAWWVAVSDSSQAQPRASIAPGKARATSPPRPAGAASAGDPGSQGSGAPGLVGAIPSLLPQIFPPAAPSPPPTPPLETGPPPAVPGANGPPAVTSPPPPVNPGTPPGPPVNPRPLGAPPPLVSTPPPAANPPPQNPPPVNAPPPKRARNPRSGG